jgi:hypothetical protein
MSRVGELTWGGKRRIGARYYRPMARGLPPDVAQLFEACLAEVRKVWPGMR